MRVQPIVDGVTCSLSRADPLRQAPCGFVPSMVGDQQSWLITSGINFSYALNGLSSGTPKGLKSATFRVTTVRP